MSFERRTVKAVMLQAAPRLDSLAALFLLAHTWEGQEKYPGIKTADLREWRFGTFSPQGKTWQDFWAEGVICLGCLGSPFDEHPNGDFGDRKAGKMSTTLLVAQNLGIDHHPLYRRLVQLVTNIDLGITQQDQLGLSVLIKMMYRAGASTRQVVDLVSTSLVSFLINQQRFLDAVVSAQDTDMVAISGPNGQSYQVGLIRSDNEQIWAGVRHCFQQEKVAALVQIRSSGHVMIYGNQRLGVRINAVIGAWRYHELHERGLGHIAEDRSVDLEQPGQMEVLPNICFQLPGQNGLNSSETAPDVEPTALSVDFIRQLVCENISFETTVQATLADAEDAEAA